MAECLINKAMGQLTRAGISRAERQAPNAVTSVSGRGCKFGLDRNPNRRLSLPNRAGTSLQGSGVARGPDRLVGHPDRVEAPGRLAPDESERLLRVSAVFENAVELLEGDVAGAVTWLTVPRRHWAIKRPWRIHEPNWGPAKSRA